MISEVVFKREGGGSEDVTRGERICESNWI